MRHQSELTFDEGPESTLSSITVALVEAGTSALITTQRRVCRSSFGVSSSLISTTSRLSITTDTPMPSLRGSLAPSRQRWSGIAARQVILYDLSDGGMVAASRAWSVSPGVRGCRRNAVSARPIARTTSASSSISAPSASKMRYIVGAALWLFVVRAFTTSGRPP